MKRMTRCVKHILFLILCIVPMAASAYDVMVDSVYYQPFIQEGKTWEVVSFGQSIWWLDQYVTKPTGTLKYWFDKSQGETVNGVEYTAMMVAGPNGVAHREGLFREEDGRVYYYHDGQEFLHMDMNLSLGDEFELKDVYHDGPIRCKVTSVKEVDVYGQKRKEIDFVAWPEEYESPIDEKNVWIEGLGSPIGPTYLYYDYSVGDDVESVKSVICDGNLLYAAPFNAKHYFGWPLEDKRDSDYSGLGQGGSRLKVFTEGETLHIKGCMWAKCSSSLYVYCTISKDNVIDVWIEDLIPKESTGDYSAGFHTVDLAIPAYHTGILTWTDSDGDHSITLVDGSEVKYMPFVENDKEWYTVEFCPQRISEGVCSSRGADASYYYYFDPEDIGTKEINGKRYQTLEKSPEPWVCFDTDYAEKTEIGHYREEYGRVYRYDATLGKDCMTYDFTLGGNDEFELNPYPEKDTAAWTCKVTEVGSMLIRGNVLKTIRFMATPPSGGAPAENFWIEGIGNPHNVARGVCHPQYAPAELTHTGYMIRGLEEGVGKFFPFDVKISCYHTMPISSVGKEDFTEPLIQLSVEEGKLRVRGQLYDSGSKYKYLECSTNDDRKITLNLHAVGHVWDQGKFYPVDALFDVLKEEGVYKLDYQGESYEVEYKKGGSDTENQYLPMVQEGKTWIVDSYQYFVPLATWEVATWKLQGDSTINGRKCMKLYCNNSYMGAAYDEEEKTYFIPRGKEEAVLLYDFGLQKGETTQVYSNGTAGDGKHVAEVMVRDVSSRAYGKREFCYVNFEKVGNIKGCGWIEGIGSCQDPLTPWFDTDLVGGVSRGLRCCAVNGEMLYFNENEGKPFVASEPGYEMIPFCEEGKKWVVEENGKSLTYVMQGDTVIAGQAAKRMFRNNEYIGSFFDDGYKTYNIAPGTEEPRLYYNFSLRTFGLSRVWNGESYCQLTVLDTPDFGIGNILRNTCQMSYLQIEDGAEHNVTDLLSKNAGTWVEGLGSLYGPMVNCGTSDTKSTLKACRTPSRVLYDPDNILPKTDTGTSLWQAGTSWDVYETSDEPSGDNAGDIIASYTLREATDGYLALEKTPMADGIKGEPQLQGYIRNEDDQMIYVRPVLEDGTVGEESLLYDFREMCEYGETLRYGVMGGEVKEMYIDWHTDSLDYYILHGEGQRCLPAWQGIVYRYGYLGGPMELFYNQAVPSRTKRPKPSNISHVIFTTKGGKGAKVNGTESGWDVYIPYDSMLEPGKMWECLAVRGNDSKENQIYTIEVAGERMIGGRRCTVLRSPEMGVEKTVFEEGRKLYDVRDDSPELLLDFGLESGDRIDEVKSVLDVSTQDDHRIITIDTGAECEPYEWDKTPWLYSWVEGIGASRDGGFLPDYETSYLLRCWRDGNLIYQTKAYDTVGIRNVETDADATLYDLTGRRTDGNTRGVMIRNGKKYVK